jgi:formylglycine-generating enzyme
MFDRSRQCITAVAAVITVVVCMALVFAACGGDTYPVVWIEPGTFTMGSPDTEPGRLDWEGPQHSVTLTKGFYMGKYPVTQGLYKAVMGSNPSYFTNNPAAGEAQAKRPAEAVSWYDALVFCNRLSMRDGLVPVYSISGSTNPASWGEVPASGNFAWDAVVMNRNANGYRLPTEAEWEYACRAGTTTAYNTGAEISDATGWYSANSGGMTHEAGKKPANAWGVYDMHGNVWEWVWDWYGSYAGDVSDPTGPDTMLLLSLSSFSGHSRVLRGGSWDNGAQRLRSSCRGDGYPPGRGNDFGFRVVRGQ